MTEGECLNIQIPFQGHSKEVCISLLLTVGVDCHYGARIIQKIPREYEMSLNWEATVNNLLSQNNTIKVFFDCFRESTMSW